MNCVLLKTLIAVPNAVLHSLHVRPGSFWVVSQTRNETNYVNMLLEIHRL